jgi:hypothetical protein
MKCDMGMVRISGQAAAEKGLSQRTIEIVIMRMPAVGLLLAMTVGGAWAQTDQAKLTARSFGYALQAMGWCDGFLVHGQTEEKLETIIGQSLREGDLKDDYAAGLFRFTEEEAENGTDKACADAWSRVGPGGSEYNNLLMESPF